MKPVHPQPSPWLNLEDFERAARQRLPACLYGFAAHGSEDCASVHANRESFAQWRWVPHVLTDVSQVSQECTVFGRSYASPFGIAPMGAAALFCHRADSALAKAAHQARIPFVLSGASSVPLEEIAQQAPSSWYQGYLPGDEDRLKALLGRIGSAGYEVLVVTVDVPVASNREKDCRLGFSVPLRPSLRLATDGLLHPRWLLGTFARTLLTDGVPRLVNYTGVPDDHPLTRPPPPAMRVGRDRLTWEHLAFLRRHWPGALVVKGLLAPKDAARAVSLGADGIVVSNHGGRQLDGCASPLEVLPDMVEASRGAEVFLDGGVRRGTDVLKALALGARLVFAGRPFLYAASIAAQQGVADAIAILQREIKLDLALLGCTGIGQLGRQHLLSSSASKPP